MAHQQTGREHRRVELWKLIQAYLDEYGSTASWVARQMGTNSQTLYNWRDRGVKDLPSDKSLRRLAAAIRQPYATVLAAALIDAGRWTDDDGELDLGQPHSPQQSA
jgi:hypothetical protein